MTDISIHALLAESDLTIMLYDSSVLIFLSTLSLRRATSWRLVMILLSLYFYPRSPCGERLFRQNYECFEWIISIHALLAESDTLTDDVSSGGRIFLSTLSLRRATAKVHKTVGHFCAYGTNFMGIASSC